MAALDGKERTASIKATTRLRCLTLGDGSFRQFLIDNPIIAVNLLPEIVRRFRSVSPHATSGTKATPRARLSALRQAAVAVVDCRTGVPRAGLRSHP